MPSPTKAKRMKTTMKMNKVEVVLEKDRDTKNFHKFGSQDADDGKMALTTVYVRQGTIAESALKVRVTVEVIE